SPMLMGVLARQSRVESSEPRAQSREPSSTPQTPLPRAPAQRLDSQLSTLDSRLSTSQAADSSHRAPNPPTSSSEHAELKVALGLAANVLGQLRDLGHGLVEVGHRIVRVHVEAVVLAHAAEHPLAPLDAAEDGVRRLRRPVEAAAHRIELLRDRVQALDR